MENLFVYVEYFDGMVRSDGEKFLKHHVLTQKEFDEDESYGYWQHDSYHIKERLTKEEVDKLKLSAEKYNLEREF